MPNRLATEKSPYLRQHADNPVDWLPWGETAFAKARAEQKPIFLSIGYSTCHWCHVMAHESFENAETAALLNEHFVSIKVDREERPDVDKVYMSYVQALTGHGGWPLSAFLTPELKPFYGGTYFPPEDRHGRAGFPSLLRAIARGWADEREKLVAEADRVIASLQEYYAQGAEARTARKDGAGEAALVEAAGEAFEKAYQYFYENFDAAEGGFGGAPKFPRASNLDFLFRCAALQGISSESGREAIQMATHTLAQMARGGIHDHVGGGFHRYAVDDAWFVPHFEKMLYDQAQIAVNALDAYQFSNDERYTWLARDIFDYVQRDLTHPAGGFYSAEDADSEVPESVGPALVAGPESESRAARGGLPASGSPTGNRPHAEGAFYVWTRAELERVLGDDAAFFCDHFGVTAEGNVPAALDPHGELRGKNVLKQRQSLADTAKAHHLDLQTAADRLAMLLERLRAVRAQRPRPHLDDKIITAWNGLMISAFARGATCPAECLADKREFYREAAVRAARFIERELHEAERAVLYRNWREGRGANEGFAEDYAFFITGLLDLYEATFDAHWLEWAVRLQTTMNARFWDEAGGGYFNSAAGDASIVLRLKEDYDGAEPSPNSVAASNLLRFAAIFEPGATASADTGDPAHGANYRARALRTIESLRRQWSRAPHAVPALLCAIERALAEPRHVVLAGDRQTADFAALAAVVHAARPAARFTVLAADPELVAPASWLAPMQPREGRATAYVCEHYACQAPVTTPAELKGLLERG